MSAETLRRAAALMREQHGPDHERHEMWGAMADWLESSAEDLDMQSPGGPLREHWDMRVHIACAKALVVARAYLGGDA